jgi:hypothetical protein
MRSPPHQERPASPPRAAIRFRGESSQRQHFTPDWAPTSSSLLRPIYDDNGVMWVPYQQSFHPDGEDQGDQHWIESQDILKIAGLHDKPGRVTRLTRLDSPCRRSDRPPQKRAISSEKGVQAQDQRGGNSGDGHRPREDY